MFSWHAVVFDDHVVLGWSGRQHDITIVVENRFLADTFGEIELFIEGRCFLGIVSLHLGLFPDAQRMGSVHMRDLQDVGQPLTGDAGIPVVTVDELVFELVPLDEAQRILAPFHQLFVEVFLGDEFIAAAGHADDPDPSADRIHVRLLFKLAGPDIHVVAELAEFLGEF